MPSYVIYRLDNGLIQQSGSGSPPVSERPVPDGHAIMETEGEVDFRTHRVEDGQIVSIPPKPAPFYEWQDGWVDPRSEQQKADDKWRGVRAERNRLLAASDWTVLPDVPAANQTAWREYRQALRDITAQPDPFNIIWPAPPSA